jgi:hypothetical protein
VRQKRAVVRTCAAVHAPPNNFFNKGVNEHLACANTTSIIHGQILIRQYNYRKTHENLLKQQGSTETGGAAHM